MTDTTRFWNFVEGEFLDMTVPSHSAGGRALAENELGWTLGMNYLVGHLQMRQIRTKVVTRQFVCLCDPVCQVDKCFVRDEYVSKINHCYQPFRSDTEDQAAFGPSHQ